MDAQARGHQPIRRHSPVDEGTDPPSRHHRLDRENILVHGGTVRIDLASYLPGDKTNGDQPPALELTGRLVMPLEGFVRAFGGFREVVRQMVEAGVIEPVEGGRAGGRA